MVYFYYYYYKLKLIQDYFHETMTMCTDVKTVLQYLLVAIAANCENGSKRLLLIRDSEGYQAVISDSEVQEVAEVRLVVIGICGRD